MKNHSTQSGFTRLKFQRNFGGFTIIELMLATVVFSLVLMLCLTGLIQVGRVYFKGVTQARTQEAARVLMDEITQSIQFSADVIELSPGPAGPNVQSANPASDNYRTLCVGDKRISFVIDRQVTGVVDETATVKTTPHAVWIDNFSSCANANPEQVDLGLPIPTTGGREILGENMRLSRLNIGAVDSSARLWNVRIGVVYGAQDLIEYADSDGDGIREARCRPGTSGTEYCAFSELNSMVQRRVQ